MNDMVLYSYLQLKRNTVIIMKCSAAFIHFVITDQANIIAAELCICFVD